MQKIKQLPLHEAQKIAAGEVVERPANVVKELVENALDAGATTISIYIENAGKKLIRIIDNGSGMSVEDAHACFGQYATSKITSVTELPTLTTFGFRGEALASISAVSKIILTTKEANAQTGISLHRENNIVTRNEDVSSNTGTDISVHDLFYNVPARKKFLKTDETEWRAILQLFQALCLDYRSIHFKLFSDNKLIHNCPPTDDLKNRFMQLWDHHTADSMLELSISESSTISGLISHHQFLRYDRGLIFFFVNNRWIKNQQLSKALLKGYLNILPAQRYPAACIALQINPSEVDINIHPRKEEVQFLHPRIIEQQLYAAVKKTLEQQITTQVHKSVPKLPEQKFSYFKPLSHFIPAQSTASTHVSFQSLVNKDTLEPIVSENRIISNISTEQIESIPPAKHVQKIIIPAETPSYAIIGQYKKTYILLEQDDGLFLVDQHAAHERILYELFKKQFGQLPTINLLFPHVIELTAQEYTTIYPHLGLLNMHSIGIEPFSQQHLIVHSTSVHLKNIDLTTLIREIIGIINEHTHVEQQQLHTLLHERLHAQMACKAAVKAGDVLSQEQMKQLLNDLVTAENRFSCPHGRPTGWLLPLYEIEKKFKRKV